MADFKNRDRLEPKKNNTLYMTLAAVLIVALLIGYVMRDSNENLMTPQAQTTMTAPAQQNTSPNESYMEPASGLETDVAPLENNTINDTAPKGTDNPVVQP